MRSNHVAASNQFTNLSAVHERGLADVTGTHKKVPYPPETFKSVNHVRMRAHSSVVEREEERCAPLQPATRQHIVRLLWQHSGECLHMCGKLSGLQLVDGRIRRREPATLVLQSIEDVMIDQRHCLRASHASPSSSMSGTWSAKAVPIRPSAGLLFRAVVLPREKSPAASFRSRPSYPVPLDVG